MEKSNAYRRMQAMSAAGGLGVEPSGRCASAYQSGYTVPESREPLASRVLRSVPKLGSSFKTEAGICSVRTTDHAKDYARSAFFRTDYSRRQAFNADSTLLLVYAYDGSWHLYDARTQTYIRSIAGLAGDCEPQWHPTNPNLLRYLPYNGIGGKIYEYDYISNSSRLLADLMTRVRALWPKAESVWTKSEGSPSIDHSRWAFMVTYYNPQTQIVTQYGFFTYDLLTDQIIASHDATGFDHLSMSPTGNYVVTSSYNTDGVQVWPADLSSSTRIASNGEHSDIGINKDGDDMYLSVDYGAGDGAIYMVNLRTKQRTDLLPTYINGSATAMHFSGKAFNKPGFFVLSTYAGSVRNAGDKIWLHDSIFVVEMKANPRVFPISRTHVNYQGYFTEPHASANRELTKIIANTNWDKADALNIDVAMAQLPSSSLV